MEPTPKELKELAELIASVVGNSPRSSSVRSSLKEDIYATDKYAKKESSKDRETKDKPLPDVDVATLMSFLNSGIETYEADLAKNNDPVSYVMNTTGISTIKFIIYGIEQGWCSKDFRIKRKLGLA
jgi:hypothetical protein